ncbi:MAG: DMT family transporter [Spirochaetaceae bacterium]|nr:MAG: DMT family transporter [Spirochaetaceae bacterium]
MIGAPMKTNTQTIGTILVVVSAVSFGAMAIFARIAYADGMDPASLLLLRFAIAAIVMIALVAIRGDRLPRGRALFGFIAMGAIGYFGQSLCFFTALTMANAGLVALLLYLYPAIVTGLSALFAGERLTRRAVIAIVTALVGTALTVGPKLDARPMGVLLGVAAALIYSVYILVGTRLVHGSSPIASSAVIMTAAAVAFGALGAARGVTLPATASGWVGVAGVAIVATVIAITTFLYGLRLIGPTRASVLSTLEPVTTVVLAAVALGEPIGVLSAVGGGLILVGAILLSGPTAPRSAPPGPSLPHDDAIASSS